MKLLVVGTCAYCGGPVARIKEPETIDGYVRVCNWCHRTALHAYGDPIPMNEVRPMRSSKETEHDGG